MAGRVLRTMESGPRGKEIGSESFTSGSNINNSTPYCEKELEVEINYLQVSRIILMNHRILLSPCQRVGVSPATDWRHCRAVAPAPHVFFMEDAATLAVQPPDFEQIMGAFKRLDLGTILELFELLITAIKHCENCHTATKVEERQTPKALEEGVQVQLVPHKV